MLRRPRRDWTIPAPDAYERLVKEKQEEARLKEYWQGTTPYGREIFRRMLHSAWKRCEQNQSTPEVVAQVEAELRRTFQFIYRNVYNLLAASAPSNLVDTRYTQQLPALNIITNINFLVG